MQGGYVATQPNIPQLAHPNQQWSPPDYTVILTLKNVYLEENLSNLLQMFDWISKEKWSLIQKIRLISKKNICLQNFTCHSFNRISRPFVNILNYLCFDQCTFCNLKRKLLNHVVQLFCACL